MKKLILLSAVSAFLINCNKKTEAPAPKTEADTIAVAEPIVDTLGPKSFCYIGVTGKDSVFASIDDNLGTIIGKLSYKNSEKDSSKGDVTGFKSGDTLKLTYEFASEGKKSKRDIYFLQKDNTLTEGIGDHKEEDGHSKYADEKKISYQDGQKLNTADCKAVNKGLK
ncbi:MULTISPECIES: hypothetical protein [Chryseobacterium]|jgi:hypothetical protein|uniref:Lipoprotein n=1 Tax=Chryseobacterium rhizosphaerae TaxID=395937 RepID=A0ABX9IG96_9FLAO|nr:MULTISPECIES: hypothetical protein [Chryseobacterium]MBL3550342.1 hypothetical protein [Chryseobacterium sp. KMC2]MDC8100142.1 hypothetical protein [Chryseobacterium rhizosphaerae]MDR6548670.1 hypothetical protein [Chryseobacterium rhizosphaerae]REC72658.1 hypothetical protein DRF57_19070 [Chryseobacterium rhizosphaerae]SMC34768.1 hypothetical protein SAMN02787074_0511 [Chryseobacterium sp. YR221]